MKVSRLLFLIFFLNFSFIQLKVIAQATYTLTTSTETFQLLNNPTVMSWTTNYSLDLPFTFYINDNPLDTALINVTNDGYVNFGNQGIVSLSASMNKLNNSTQTGFQVDGSSPNRILKIEWKNHGFSKTAAATDSLTFQLWLYETTNVIEWHFGKSVWTANSIGVGPFILIKANATDYCNISGNSSSDIMYSCCGFTCHINYIPTMGTVFKLTPPPTNVGISKQQSLENESEVILYPNPTSNEITIKMGDLISLTTIRLFDIFGKEILTTTSDNSTKLSLSECANGLYFLEVGNESKKEVFKIIKQ